jgi:protease I
MSEAPEDIHKISSQPKSPKGRVAILTADGTEDQEFFYPYYRLTEAGYAVDVITPDGKEFKGKNGAGLKSTMKLSNVNPDDYELLYIPGGKAPEKLKKEDEAVDFVVDYVETGKPVASICHGPQLLAKAGVIDGVRIAAWPECQEEVEDAGASYVNEESVQDGQFITARWPGDLPAHLSKVMDVMQRLESSSQKKVA